MWKRIDDESILVDFRRFIQENSVDPVEISHW